MFVKQDFVNFLLIIFSTFGFNCDFINCFNLDTNFPIVYVDPNLNRDRSSYFGYSVVLFPGNNYFQPWQVLIFKNKLLNSVTVKCL